MSDRAKTNGYETNEEGFSPSFFLFRRDEGSSLCFTGDMTRRDLSPLTLGRSLINFGCTTRYALFVFQCGGGVEVRGQRVYKVRLLIFLLFS